jgi:7-cyano-7-deazaguanine synthase
MEGKQLAVVLVSGGMDSCVAASVAALDYSLAFLHVNYGQRTEAREKKAFHDLCEFFKPDKKLIIDISYLEKIGGSALTDRSINVPVNTEPGVQEIPATYVPFRNAHFLAMAVSWAEVIGARKIFIGAVEEDSSGYPDCREVFYSAFQAAVDKGTKPSSQIMIETPLIHKTKKGIVEAGSRLSSPFNLTWSCYKDEDSACGECDSCKLRLKGFKEARVKDSIPYKR